MRAWLGRLSVLIGCICSLGICSEEDNSIYSKTATLYQLASIFSFNLSVPILDTMSESGGCFEETSDAVMFGHEYVAVETTQMKSSGSTLVSVPRLVATAWLARAALSLAEQGDFVETGVFKCGTSIILARILQNFDKCKNHFWGFDSFEGLPEVTPQDIGGGGQVGRAGMYKATHKTCVSNFLKFDAYKRAESIHIIKGYFNVTLPVAPIKKISFLRLDGDMFTSTWDALVNLYDKVIPGGYIYVDDYESFNGCKRAVDQFRLERGITEPMTRILEGKRKEHKMKKEVEAVWWKKRK